MDRDSTFRPLAMANLPDPLLTLFVYNQEQGCYPPLVLPPLHAPSSKSSYEAKLLLLEAGRPLSLLSLTFWRNK